MNKPECMREVQEDNQKKWLSSKDPALFAFTPRKLEIDCKEHCKSYDTCKETKDRLARLLARNWDNTCKRPDRRFNDDFYNLDDR